MRATRAVIHLDNLRHNIRLAAKTTGVKICMPVKADAYGHGVLPVARTALEEGVFSLAVATVQEGKELREGGIGGPVLLLSVPLPEELPDLAAAELEPLVSDGEFAAALNEAALAAGKRIAIHLKIDTGMSRLGCRPGEAGDLAAAAAGLPGLSIAGTATHFAVSDGPGEEDRRYTAEQLERFREGVENIRRRSIDPGIIHAANTGGVTFHRNSWFSMVRPGVLLYGYPPAGNHPFTDIKPVMELESRIVFLKTVRRGETVSYGRTWTAPEDTVVGTLPVGYADGLPRLLSGKWQVLAGGQLCPLVGRICMDQCMVNLGRETRVQRWEKVTIFGGDAPHAGELASRIGTIPYEITSNINKRVPRVYL